MPGFKFITSEATLSLGVGGSESKSPCLSYSVRQGLFEDSVELATGQTLQDLSGEITISADFDKRLPVQDNSIGVMKYFEASEFDLCDHPLSYSIEVVVPETLREELIFAARSGRLPSELLVEVDEDEHISRVSQTDPDDDRLKWDNKIVGSLNVKSAKFILPLAGNELLTPSRRQIENVIHRVDKLLDAQSSFPELFKSISELKNTVEIAFKFIIYTLVGIGLLIVFFR